MPYVSSDDILEARKMDLLTYLQNYEPQELVKFSADTYTTKSHDSLKISNGKWMWWSRGIGGHSPRLPCQSRKYALYQGG